MAGLEPMEEKKEKRLIIFSSSMFAVAVAFFWIAMPQELFSGITRNTAVSWITGKAEGYHLLSRLQLALPLGVIFGGIAAFIMAGLFAYHRYRSALNLRKENPEGAFYPDNASEQDDQNNPFNEEPSEGGLTRYDNSTIENDEIILEAEISKERSFIEETASSDKPKENNAAVIILGDYSKKIVSEADRDSSDREDLYINMDEQTEDLEKQSLETARSLASEKALEKEKRPDKDNSTSIQSEETVTSSFEDIKAEYSRPEKDRAEETLFLSSEQILQKPIQDSPDPVSAPPTSAIKLSQLDRDQALHQALVLIKEMRQQLISASKL